MTRATRCPACGDGLLAARIVREEMGGADLGSYEADVCVQCGESFLDAKEMERLERRARKAGVWNKAGRRFRHNA